MKRAFFMASMLVATFGCGRDLAGIDSGACGDEPRLEIVTLDPCVVDLDASASYEVTATVRVSCSHSIGSLTPLRIHRSLECESAGSSGEAPPSPCLGEGRQSALVSGAPMGAERERLWQFSFEAATDRTLGQIRDYLAQAPPNFDLDLSARLRVSLELVAPNGDLVTTKPYVVDVRFCIVCDENICDG